MRKLRTLMEIDYKKKIPDFYTTDLISLKTALSEDATTTHISAELKSILKNKTQT
jgi:hypothetical protein